MNEPELECCREESYGLSSTGAAVVAAVAEEAAEESEQELEAAQNLTFV